MKYVSYGHRHGDVEIPKKIAAEIYSIIGECEGSLRKGGIPIIRKNILSQLYAKGWSSEVKIDSTSKISIASMRQRIGLCFQVGNAGRMYADLMKLQTVYIRGGIDCGIFITFNKDAAKKTGENVVNFERLTNELKIFDRTITLPLLVIGIS